MRYNQDSLDLSLRLLANSRIIVLHGAVRGVGGNGDERGRGGVAGCVDQGGQKVCTEAVTREGAGKWILWH